MSRANIPENERKDFCLFVDEFQNFATDSFESILSEARKYRLNLVVVNQFMGQLIDKIRGAIHGNVGTYVIGRVGTDDVEDVVKMLQPVFQPEDLLFMPNYTAAVKMLINGSPTSPFSMQLPPLMTEANPELGKALAKLSASKYGRPRAEVEAEIKRRWSASKAAAPVRKPANSSVTARSNNSSGGDSGSFLDNWLAKRQNISSKSKAGPGTGTVKNIPTSTMMNQNQTGARVVNPPSMTTTPAASPMSAGVSQTSSSGTAVSQQSIIAQSPIQQAGVPIQPLMTNGNMSAQLAQPQPVAQRPISVPQVQPPQQVQQSQSAMVAQRPINDGTEWSSARQTISYQPPRPAASYRQPQSTQSVSPNSSNAPANQKGGQFAKDGDEFVISLH